MRLECNAVLALSLCAAGCANEAVDPPPPPPVNWQSLEVRKTAPSDVPTAHERAVAEAYLAALASPGFSSLGARLDPDAHFMFPGAHDAHGRDAIVQAHDSLLGAFDERTIVASRIWRTSSTQAVEWSLTGHQSREWMGVKAANKAVTIRGMALMWTRDDGSITDLHLYFDIAAVRAQLGEAPRGLVDVAKSAFDGAHGAGSTEPPRLFEQTASSAEASNVALVRAALSALEGSDVAGYEAVMADSVDVQTPESARRGKGDAGAYFKAMHAAIGQLDTTVTEAWGVGPFALVEYTIAGEQVGPIDGIPVQRDKALVLHILDVVEVASDKIAAIWRYDNRSELLTELSF
jgi:hypothetical protein